MQQLVRLVTVLALLAVTHPALAQSPTALDIDSEAVLVNKNVGTQQWSISRSLVSRNVTGNVFEPGQPPQFVFCRQQPQMVNDVLQLDCQGGGRCEDSPCADEWTPLGTVSLPVSFFSVGPAGPPGLEGLLGRWRVYDHLYDGPSLGQRFFLHTIETSGGKPTLVGEDLDGHGIVVRYLADFDPNSTLPYEFVAAIDDGFHCRLYYFDRDGDTWRGRDSFQNKPGGLCGGTTSMIDFEAARLGSMAPALTALPHEDVTIERAPEAAQDIDGETSGGAAP